MGFPVVVSQLDRFMYLEEFFEIILGEHGLNPQVTMKP